MILTEAERGTPVFRKLMQFHFDRLKSLREQNDGNHDALVTAGIRGQIAAEIEFLALDRAQPVIKDE